MREHDMTITQGWDNPEKTIYRIDINDVWTWNDFNAAIDESNRVMAAQAPNKVDLIMCVNTPLPSGNAISHLRRSGGSQPANTHRTVIVNETGLLFEMLIRSVDKVKGWQGPAMVKTMAEARTLLSIQDK
jgi:hypothetical protein